MLPVFAVVCSSDALPWTVLTPISSRLGWYAARRIAKASYEGYQQADLFESSRGDVDERHGLGDVINVHLEGGSWLLDYLDRNQAKLA